MRSPVVFEDIHFHQRRYDPWAAYGQSKTANVFAVDASTRWASDGITVNALMPGGIRTNLQRYTTDQELERMRAESAGGPRGVAAYAIDPEAAARLWELSVDAVASRAAAA